MDSIRFLTIEDVEYIHRTQLELFGGQDGYIEKGVVESAIAQPQQGMFGEYLHEDIAHMAAAYMFHIATTQGFMDGNKRTALSCASAFLRLNGFAIDVSDEDMYPIALSVAKNEMSKDALWDWISEHIRAVE